MSQESSSEVPMVPLQEEHSPEDVKVIVTGGEASAKDTVPLGEQCMEPQCAKRAVGECAFKDCKKRLCVDHKKQLNYAHDHRVLCFIHHQRAQFQYRGLLAVVLLVIVIGALVYAVPNQTDFCDGKADGQYCKTPSSFVTCVSGYGSGNDYVCPKWNGIQWLCYQCSSIVATCLASACPIANSTISH